MVCKPLSLIRKWLLLVNIPFINPVNGPFKAMTGRCRAHLLCPTLGASALPMPRNGLRTRGPSWWHWGFWTIFRQDIVYIVGIDAIEYVFCFSPPARWGLLDFMSVDFRLPPPSAAFRLLRTSTTTIHARENPRQVFPAGPQPRPSTPSVPCRTSTARIHAQCSLPDLNRENPRQVFPAGPQPPERMPKDMPDRMP